MNKVSSKKISVIGAARSGMAAAIELKRHGAEVYLSDAKPEDQWSAPRLNEIKRSLSDNRINFEFGGHSEKIYDCDLFVTSPGVAADSPVLQNAVARGIKVISELELGFWLCPAKVIAITGSNGKTTTTSLVGEIFHQAKRKYAVAGNIGTPYCSVASMLGPNDFAILEVSSFQLEWIESFKPTVAAILNITPDHLDRHASMEEYVGLKMRVFANQSDGDTAVLNADDPLLMKKRESLNAVLFSTSKELAQGCFALNDVINLSLGGNRRQLLKVSELGIKGPHNLANACAAAAIAASAGIADDHVIKALRTFTGVEHRLEKVGLIGGVSFINDSKATNVDAVFWALQSVSPPIVLIAGGKDKGGDFRQLESLIRNNVSAVVLIGQATEKIAAAFDGIVTIEKAQSLPLAVKRAYELAYPRGTVLLSPGCASFDMFENYEHRGRVFKETVRALMESRG